MIYYVEKPAHELIGIIESIFSTKFRQTIVGPYVAEICDGKSIHDKTWPENNVWFGVKLSQAGYGSSRVEFSVYNSCAPGFPTSLSTSLDEMLNGDFKFLSSQQKGNIIFNLDLFTQKTKTENV